MARIACALVDVGVTMSTGVAGASTIAKVIVHQIPANTIVDARLRAAIVVVDFTKITAKTFQTFTTNVNFTARCRCDITCAVIQTWILLAQ